MITDRVVLDRQLQNTIYQFDHRQGVVQKIDEDSCQLAKDDPNVERKKAARALARFMRLHPPAFRPRPGARGSGIAGLPSWWPDFPKGLECGPW